MPPVHSPPLMSSSTGFGQCNDVASNGDYHRYSGSRDSDWAYRRSVYMETVFAPLYILIAWEKP